MTKLTSYRFLFILLVISLLWGNYSLAQNNNNPLFTNIKVKNGLPSNEIFDITQDSLGFMWFATNNGIVRYDGYNMMVYRKNRSNNVALTNNQITCISNGKELGIWAGSYEGLTYLNSKTGESKNIDLAGIREIRCLLNQGDSVIWAGSAEGLFKIKCNDFSYQIFTQDNSVLGSNIVRSLFLDCNNTLWIGTFDGINYLTSEGNMKHFDLKGTYKPELKNNLVLDIEPYSESNDTLLWIGTETGLIKFNRISEKFNIYNSTNTNFENEVVKCIFTSKPGEVYLGTDFGFYYLNTTTGEISGSFHEPFNNYSISNNVVWDIFEDNSGVIWLATSNGISKLNFNQSMFKFTPIYSNTNNKTIGTQVNDLYVDENETIWLATKKGVIAQYKNGKQENFTANKKSKNRLVLNNVNTISGDYLGRIWIGSAGGINIWDANLKKMHTITADFDMHKGLRSNYIGAFITPPDGSFWMTTWGGGMYKVKGDFENINDINFEYLTNFNTNVFSTYKKIWLKHENKIFSIDLSTGAIENSNKLNKHFTNDDIESLHISAKGILWIGTHNALTSYNIQNENITDYNIFTGNSSNIFNLQEDHKGNIWGTTLTAIFKFSPETQAIETFPKNTGIPLDNFLYESKATSNNGQLYFGGNDGYISFDPEEIKKNTFQPKILITDLKVNNISIHSLSELGSKNHTKNLITYSNKVVLRYDQHSFTLGFASMHFGEPERNIYAYKLEGYNDDWQYTSGIKNDASYSNLSSGKYVFKVRGTNNDGVWFNNENALQIIVKPPVWASPIAIVIYIVALQILLILLISTYRNKIKWKERIRIITLEKEKNEELAKSKQQFFTNISHEFRTPLSLILGPAETLLYKKKPDGDDSQLLTLIIKNTQRLFSLVNQLLDLRKIELNTLQLKTETTDIIEICTKQYNLFIDLAESKNINYTFNSNIKTLNTTIDVPKFESIIQNLLSNAFKFTPLNGTISFDAKLKETSLFSIQISDSGKGINEISKPNIFKRFYQGENVDNNQSGYGIGLNIAKEYCDLMQGKIWFENNQPQGTIFNVEIPTEYTMTEINELSSVHFEFENTKISTSTTNTNLPYILITDDHPDTLKYLKIKLKDNYNIITANSGKNAFAILEKQKIDLIISDIMMPEMDGIQFCEKVKQHPKFENIPLILLTAKTMENQKIEGFRAGSDAYITKPFDVAVVNAQMESLLAKNRKIDNYIKRQLIVENHDIDVQSSDEKLLKETIQYINDHLSDPEINLEKMCRKIGVSHSSLYRKIKSQTGMTLNELIRSTKLKRAAQLLKTDKLSIAEIMAETGFTNHSYFAKCFKKEYKVSPREYK